MTEEKASRAAALLPALLLASLAASAVGCSLIVTRGEFEEEQKQTRSQILAVRKQLLAQDRTLTNHGKAIEETRSQVRDAVSLVRKEIASLRDETKKREAAAPFPQPPVRREASRFEIGVSLFIRRTFRGLPLNYAGGYRVPRGARYHYTLTPGTRVRTLTGDNRGFTRVEVTSGRWKGKMMWVRTIWLIAHRPDPPRRPPRN